MATGTVPGERVEERPLKDGLFPSLDVEPSLRGSVLMVICTRHRTGWRTPDNTGSWPPGPWLGFASAAPLILDRAAPPARPRPLSGRAHSHELPGMCCSCSGRATAPTWRGSKRVWRRALGRRCRAQGWRATASRWRRVGGEEPLVELVRLWAVQA
eukprot:scaffold4958_cov406-Prasinococcus_capsulatus_cf.AAC.21